VKPRYEFIIVFTWKEPTPSDKLRPIKVAEKAAAAASGMGSPAPGPAAGRGGSPSPSPSGGSSGDSEGDGLKVRGGLKDD
jgi:hypothetical protein